MLKITIPTPCHEDWNKMTPDQTGRHCSSCAKSVVDFTGMSDDEVKLFFLNKKEDERVCGRFKQTQLHRITIELPQNIFNIQMPLWKKFLAACLVVFSTTLFSCETKIKDKEHIQNETVALTGVLLKEPDTVPATAFKTVSTLEELSGMSGGMGIVYVKTDPLPFLHISPVTDTQKLKCSNDEELNGDIEISPAKETTTEKAKPANRTNSETYIVGALTLPAIYEKRIQAKQTADSSKTKNPPKADSANCNTIKNYN